jgi:GST-like protein
MYVLYGREGWGSALVEAQLAWYGLEHRFERVGDLFGDAAARESLARVNPLAQIPTLLTPDGQVLAESVAITLHLAERCRREDWVPPPDAPERASFLRWQLFLVSSVYPTFTYADDPARFVEYEPAREGFKQRVDALRLRLWAMLEKEAGAPWFLGERMSSIDLFIAVMTHWTPRRGWFVEHAPKLAAIAERIDALPALREVLTRNFPKDAPAVMSASDE